MSKAFVRSGRLVWFCFGICAAAFPLSAQTGLDLWTARGGPGPETALRDVVGNGQLFVAVGEGGKILTSSDAVSWTARDSSVRQSLAGVAWSGSLFAAVGAGGAIVTSPDGVTWTKRVSGTITDDFHDVAWGGGRFVAVGRPSAPVFPHAAKIMTSEDGVTWVNRTASSVGHLTGVAWNGSLFVAVGPMGTILTSPDGAVWTAQASPVQSLAGVFAGGNRLVAIGDFGEAMTSTDGVNWTRSEGFHEQNFLGVTWTGSYFVGVGVGGSIMSSADGLTWLKRASGTQETLFSVAWSGGQLVAVGAKSTILTSVPSTAGPTITLPPQDQTVTAGGAASFSVSASSPDPLRYQWQRNREDIVGATSAMLTIANVQAGDTGVYRVFVINGADSVISDEAMLSVRLTAVGTEPSTVDQTQSTGPTLSDVVWTGRQFVAVGENGAVQISANGRTWRRFSLGFYYSLRGITWNGNVLVAVTDAGIVLTSVDGVEWISRAVEGAGELSAVTWNGSRFVAVGATAYPFRAVAATSSDGTQWTLHRTDDIYDSLFTVAWTGSQFVAAGGRQTIATSPDGVKWTRREMGDSGSISGMAVDEGGSRVVAVGGTYERATCYVNSGGANWMNADIASRWLSDVAWGAGQFVVVGEDGMIFVSPDGENWSRRVSVTSSSLYALTWSGTQFVAVGYRGAVVTSADGVTWSSQGSGTGENLRAVAAGGGRIVAVGEAGGIVTSMNGSGWTRRSSDSPASLENVAWNGSRFVAVGWWGTLLTSPDGTIWSTRVSPKDYDLLDVTWNGAQFVAVGGSFGGPSGVMTSPDGITWTDRPIGSNATLRAVAWGNDQFVALGLNGEVFTSSDGATWSRQLQAAYAASLSWNGTLFVGVGGYGYVVTSPDGVSWTKRNLDTTIYLRDVVWTGSQFVAVGDLGLVLTSTDGLIWTERFEGMIREDLKGVTWTGAEIVAVGARGTFFTARMAGTAPEIIRHPESGTVAVGATATLSVTATGAAPLAYQWRIGATPINGANGATLILADVQLSDTGSYDVVVIDAQGSVVSRAATLGISATAKVTGDGTEVGPDTPHPNGKIFDQVLLTGASEAITADWTLNQITRTSFIDLDDDIVQVEFSGPGTLSLVLDGATSPARPANYNQAVDYVKGHAGIIITGADERTNVSVFTVGRATAFDPTGGFNFLEPISATNDPSNNGSSLFDGHDSTNYDGIADIAYLAISSTNGKFGGVRTANAHYFASKGLTGIYAPGVAFTGPIFIGDVTAFDTALPVIVTGSSADARITGGDLLQDNGQPVEVSGLAQLRFVDGSTSAGELLPARANQAILEADGVNVTEAIVVNPAP